MKHILTWLPLYGLIYDSIEDVSWDYPSWLYCSYRIWMFGTTLISGLYIGRMIGKFIVNTY